MTRPTRRWLITGATGQLGGHVTRLLAPRAPRETLLGIARSASHRENEIAVMECNLADSAALAGHLATHAPTHIIHLGAVTAVTDARSDPAHADRVNTGATAQLGRWAAQHGARLVFASTDMVFDGEHAPYDESATPRPLSHYGRTKAAAEEALAGLPGVVIARLPLMYGFPATDRPTTFVRQIAALHAGEPLTLFTDEFRTPISLDDAARAVIALAENSCSGIVHVAGPERLSRYEMVACFAAALGVTRPHLVPVSRLSAEASEPRPADLSLTGTRFTAMFPQLSPQPISAGLWLRTD